MRRGSEVLCILGVLLGSTLTGNALSAGPFPRKDTYEPGRAGLEIDGARIQVKEASGGESYADVVTDAAGADHVRRKHLGPTKYDGISVSVGADMPKPLVGWIRDAFNLSYTRKNGAILGLDDGLKDQTRRTFTDAVISEVLFPGLEASSHEPAYIQLTLMPGSTHSAVAARSAVPPLGAAPEKAITEGSFRFTIDGLDTSHVVKIDPIDVKMQIAMQTVVKRYTVPESFPDGTSKQVPVQSTTVTGAPNLDLSNVVFYLPESQADSIAKWHEDFVTNRHNSPDKEKSGKIEMLGAKGGPPVYTLELKNLGIVQFTTEPFAADDKTRLVRVEMYVDQIAFVPGTISK